MIRPTTPTEVIIPEFTLGWTIQEIEDIPCMQEALTAEWLIEYGFMPDPSELDQQTGYGMFRPNQVH